MISVSIFINNKPIITRSAANIGLVNENDADLYQYHVDDGTIIHHRRTLGAVVLAMAMLKGVQCKPSVDVMERIK